MAMFFRLLRSDRHLTGVRAQTYAMALHLGQRRFNQVSRTLSSKFGGISIKLSPTALSVIFTGQLRD